MYQYNTKVSDPIILSSNHYGLLWYNNSLSRFGNPEDYKQLDALDPRDIDGQEGALSPVSDSRDGKMEYTRRQEYREDHKDHPKGTK